MTIPKLLSGKLLAALEALGVEVPDSSRIQVATAADLRFGDFQSNAAMVLAKAVGKNPRALAEEITGELSVDEL